MPLALQLDIAPLPSSFLTTIILISTSVRSTLPRTAGYPIPSFLPQCRRGPHPRLTLALPIRLRTTFSSDLPLRFACHYPIRSLDAQRRISLIKSVLLALYPDLDANFDRGRPLLDLGPRLRPRRPASYH
ncbi:hypothetical protein BDY19DRAFT_943722 [Irpex rosettiformis]|uniref:Uncharacterized protein n=1 Tax=Irpex rosettiformis TaxID=378272 RepID=A0ACB8U6E0_9APHY|nr:hypothetical protein BDY19DRAFT_943722 [Irpex rosettiformis]